MEAELARAIDDVYASRFPDAETALRRYLRGGEKKHEAVAHFFLGDALLT